MRGRTYKDDAERQRAKRLRRKLRGKVFASETTAGRRDKYLKRKAAGKKCPNQAPEANRKWKRKNRRQQNKLEAAKLKADKERTQTHLASKRLRFFEIRKTHPGMLKARLLFHRSKKEFVRGDITLSEMIEVEIRCCTMVGCPKPHFPWQGPPEEEAA